MPRYPQLSPRGLDLVRGGIRYPSGRYLAISARDRQTAERLTHMTGVEWTPEMVQEAQWGWTKDLAEGTEGGRLIGRHAVDDPRPLIERVGETDPERIRTGWDVP